LSVQLVSKISNLCGPDDIHQRYGQTDGRHEIPIPRFAPKCTVR